MLMKALIHFFSKLFKIIFGAVLILALFIFSYVVSVLSLSYLSKENYKKHEAPSPVFTVVLEIVAERPEDKKFVCVQWDDLKEMEEKAEGIYAGNFYIWQNFETRLSATKGRCRNMSSEFEVENGGPNWQRVRLRWRMEALWVENRYSVVGNKIVPQFHREFMSAEIVVFGFFISVVLTPIIGVILNSFLKRYKRRKMMPDSAPPANS